MRHPLKFLAGVLLAACVSGGAVAGPANILLDMERLKGIGEAKYLAAIESGASVTERTGKGYSSLQMAAVFGTPKVVSALIAAGADIMARDDYGATPLHWAANQGSDIMIHTLIVNGADVNARDKLNNTPLHYAALGMKASRVSVLLANRAKIGVKNNKGFTPLDLARKDVKVVGTWERVQNPTFKILKDANNR